MRVNSLSGEKGGMSRYRRLYKLMTLRLREAQARGVPLPLTGKNQQRFKNTLFHHVRRSISYDKLRVW